MDTTAQPLGNAPPPVCTKASCATRERILRSARWLLRDLHYADLCMGSLARLSGLSRQTLYNHFSGRDAVYRASRTLLLEALGPRIAAAAAVAGSPAARLETFVAEIAAVFALPEHFELSRSAALDAVSCPWVAHIYRARVTQPLACAAIPLLPLPRIAACADAATGLIAMIRAARNGAGLPPAFSAAEITALFLARMPATQALAWSA